VLEWTLHVASLLLGLLLLLSADQGATLTDTAVTGAAVTNAANGTTLATHWPVYQEPQVSAGNMLTQTIVLFCYITLEDIKF
jgi:hypothetical protein